MNEQNTAKSSAYPSENVRERRGAEEISRSSLELRPCSEQGARFTETSLSNSRRFSLFEITAMSGTNLGRMVRGGGFENPQAKNDASSEEFDVIDISRLKRVGE
jgi:hypothetical protein